jgi:serine/threonine protein kinase
MELDGWHPGEPQLVAFDAGALTEPDWNAVADHVAHCAACCARLERLPADALSVRIRQAGATPEPADRETDIPAPPQPPAELREHPRYRILGPLGAGGMGEVFRAEHRLMERVVALKVMRASLMNHPAAVAQFRREVKAAARLSHPHIVTAYDAEQAGAVHFLVMEFVPGMSLDRVVALHGPLPVAAACDCVRQAALGLAHAAEHGMVHRDIKPQNLMRTPEGRVKVLDFGLAQFAATAGGPAAGSGTLTGTPDYIAPEQAAAPHQADGRADIYSLGCTFYYLLTGQVPFPAAALPGAAAPPSSIGEHRPDVPPAVARVLDRILARMLAHDRADRYPDAAAVARDLAAAGLDSPPRVPARRRWRPLAALAGVLAVTMLLVYTWWPAAEDATPVPLRDRQLESVQPAERPPVAESPGPPPAVARPDLKASVSTWLKENSRHGPEHGMVGQLSARVARLVDEGRGFELSLGGGLLKSGTSTLLTAWDGELFVLPYSPEQARLLDLKPQKVEFRETGSRRDPIHAPPLLELARPRIEGADSLHESQKFSGSVEYRWRELTTGNYALRCRCTPGKQSTTRYFYLKAGLPAKDGAIAFTYGPLESAGPAYGGPVPMFFDVVNFLEPNRTDKVMVVSNPVALLITIVPAHGTK